MQRPALEGEEEQAAEHHGDLEADHEVQEDAPGPGLEEAEQGERNADFDKAHAPDPDEQAYIAHFDAVREAGVGKPFYGSRAYKVGQSAHKHNPFREG